MSIRKKEKEKTINEILNIAEFLVKLSKDKQLVNELGVNEMIKYFKENEYI